MNIPIRGSDPYIRSSDVEDNDKAVVVKEPYVQSAEKSRFGKERTIIAVKLLRTGEVYRMTLNTTSNDRLVNGFGAEGSLWVGKEIKLKVVEQNVSGVNKAVMYAVPMVQSKVALE